MDRKSLKAQVLACLNLEDAADMEKTLEKLPGRRTAGFLMGAFCHAEERVRWHAIHGIGAVCAKLFPVDPEGVRQMMRRLIWMLNDESGGIGWGCGEAMGEIMARIPAMAHAYHRILCSYLDPAGNHLENPLLQQGVLWGLARLGQASPVHVRDMGPLLSLYLKKGSPGLLASALLLAGVLGNAGNKEDVAGLLGDERDLLLYWEGRFVHVTIGGLAAGVLVDGSHKSGE